jgi:hypothetical protein
MRRVVENPFRSHAAWGAMSGYAICPYCRATVQPLVGPDGNNLCPRCHNRGVAAGAPTSASAPAYANASSQVPAARPTVPGAVASLVLGIVGVMTGIVGVVLGIIAIVMANNARRELEAAPGFYDGEGMVTAGRILGIVAIVMGALGLVFALFVFGLVSAFE